MTAAPLSSSLTAPRTSRWLMLGSLALNLFFVGAAIAFFIRAPAAPTWDRNVFVRIERLAKTLPPADADLLRGRIAADHTTIETAQTNFRATQTNIRETLRQDPFVPAAMQSAMAESRAARLNFDQIIQGVFAGAATAMSSAGRHALADWPPGQKSSSAPQ